MIHENKQLEETVLSALINNPENCHTIASILKVEYLYHFPNKVVYKAILSLLDDNEGIDLMTITMKVKKDGLLTDIGGAYFIAQLTEKGYNPTTMEAHVRILHQLYILRELKLSAEMLVSEIEQPEADPFELIDKLNVTTSKLTDIKSTRIPSVGDLFVKMVDEIKKVQDSGAPTGLLCGLKDIDKQTGGWQNGNLIVLAARPGMGKTATALHFAKFPGINNIPVAIFSLEMTALELVGRLASSESNINSTLINQKRIDRFQLNTMAGNCSRLIDSPIYIDDSSGLTISDLKAKAKRMYYEHGIKLIIIDYLQLMKGEKEGNREQEISTISRGLKGLAKDLNIPIIALSQLSRECEKRTDKRPIISDLRESGAIEQDADLVCFLFRPEMYKETYKDGYQFGDRYLDSNNLMLFDIAKGRGLMTGEVPVKFYGEFMQITDLNVF